MPFETDGRAPTGVVLLSAEDCLADTIRPRLEAAGADLTRIVSAKLDELPTLDEAGLVYIRALVERVQATLIIIDPLMAFIPDAVDTYKDHHARRLLRKLALLAEETGATVLVLRHVRKGAALNAKDAGGGSIGFTGAARVVLLAAGDPEDETTKVRPREGQPGAALPLARVSARRRRPDGHRPDGQGRVVGRDDAHGGAAARAAGDQRGGLGARRGEGGCARPRRRRACGRRPGDTRAEAPGDR
jgi:hypothetical protein